MEDTFHRDLKGGKDIESKYLEIIQELYPDATSIEGYCKEWDIFIPSKDFGIEIKSDKLSQKTGNIVVEIEMPPDKPSALSTTKARYWIFDTGVKTIVVNTDELRTLVKRFKTVVFTAKGDYTPKRAYLIPQKYIEDIQVTVNSIKYKGVLDEFL